MADTIIDGIFRVLEDEAKEIRGLVDSLDQDELLRIADAIENCKGKLVLTGCGTSGAAARKIAHTMNCIERPALFLSPAEALHGGLGVLQKEDIIFFISKGGKSFELNEMLKSCIVKGITTVAVIEKKESEFAQKCSMVLTIKVSKEPDSFGMLATASTLAVIATFDAIAIQIAERKNYTKENFLINHPGGAVGVMLSEETKK